MYICGSSTYLASLYRKVPALSLYTLCWPTAPPVSCSAGFRQDAPTSNTGCRQFPPLKDNLLPPSRQYCQHIGVHLCIRSSQVSDRPFCWQGMGHRSSKRRSNPQDRKSPKQLPAWSHSVSQGYAWIGRPKVLMHSFPYALFTPTGKAFVDAVPVAVALRQQSPGRATSCHPQDGLDIAPAIVLLSNVEV